MIVVIMDVFAPVVPFIFATIYLRLLSSLALLVDVSLLPLNAVSAPLVEGEGDHPPGYLAKSIFGLIDRKKRASIARPFLVNANKK